MKSAHRIHLAVAHSLHYSECVPHRIAAGLGRQVFLDYLQSDEPPHPELKATATIDTETKAVIILTIIPLEDNKTCFQPI